MIQRVTASTARLPHQMSVASMTLKLATDHRVFYLAFSMCMVYCSSERDAVNLRETEIVLLFLHFPNGNFVF